MEIGFESNCANCGLAIDTPSPKTEDAHEPEISTARVASLRRARDPCRMRLHPLALVIFVACNARPTIRADDSALSPADKNGTRLKLRYYVGADGSEQVAGFYDSARHENCKFQVASDGVVRCLPDQPPMWDPLTHFYSDSSCSNEVFGLPSGCRMSNIVLHTRHVTACRDGASVFPLGTSFTGQVYESDPLSLGTCQRAHSAWLAQKDFYAMGPEIPPASFVAAHEVVR